VVPSFDHRKYYYDSVGRVRYYEGTITYRTDNTTVINYPEQQYTNGVAKNNRTGKRYKQLVRILKRLENDLVNARIIKELPSYFMECIVYCVPDSQFGHTGWTPLTDDLKAVLAHIYNATGTNGSATSWKEPNEIKPLFSSSQPWTMYDAHNLTSEVWNYLKLS